jgi:pimeloyl-ACP methyl ester carboxylesterase
VKVGVTDEVSVYDRLVWPEGAIEALLASGERRRELVAFLGEEEFAALHPLAVAAAHAPRVPGRVVVLVPGIMGSQLGKPRAAPLPANLLWVDPVDFQHGRLAELSLPDQGVRSMGPVLYNYLPLKLALEAHGYTVRYHDYDWRQDIAALGLALAQRLATESARRVTVIGHSMGGLIGRVALRRMGMPKVDRLITLGAPHGGSYGALLALRGVYPLVRRIAQLDPLHSAESLTREVFSTFPSLYQMLPVHFGGFDLFDARAWPSEGPQPDASLLAQARLLDLGGPDERIVCVAGYGCDTVVDVARGEDGFRYTGDRLGDGTVPLDRAVLQGCDAWYCEAGHSDLPRSPKVQAGLLALLAEETPPLLSAPPGHESRGRFHFTDAELRRTMTAKIDWAALDHAARKRFLGSLNEPAPPWTRG